MLNYTFRKLERFILFVLAFIGILIGALYLASFVEQSTTAQELVYTFGYGGVIIIGIVGGLNMLLPIPPGVFVPLFLAAGLWLPLIIAMLAIGTTIADLIGYYIGKLGTGFVEKRYPTVAARIHELNIENPKALFAFVLIYAAFAPFPNEAFIIPLALLGVPLRHFFIPMVTGTVIYHTLFAYGIENIFGVFFG